MMVATAPSIFSVDFSLSAFIFPAGSVRIYMLSILRYCRWHCSNLEKAEDLTQETFLKLFKNLSRYKGKKKFKAYLYTIANHLCIDESRKASIME